MALTLPFLAAAGGLRFAIHPTNFRHDMALTRTVQNTTVVNSSLVPTRLHGNLVS
ncbi:MAG: hypothetical protein ABFS56_18310 [Pseudomonadota bacterium]